MKVKVYETHVELVEVDDWAPEEIVVLVEVSHTDCRSATYGKNSISTMFSFIY